MHESRAGRLTVLAGGDNSRLSLLAGTIYKGLLPIHGASIVARHVIAADTAGFESALVITDEFDPAIRGVSAHSGRIRVDYKLVRGTTGEKLLSLRQEKETWPSVVCLGDTIARVDLRKLERAPAETGVDSALVAGRYRSQFGTLEITNDGLVSTFSEKPRHPEVVNIGYLALGPLAFDLLAERPDVAAMLQALARAGELVVSQIAEDFVVVDDLLGLSNAHRALSPADTSKHSDTTEEHMP